MSHDTDLYIRGLIQAQQAQHPQRVEDAWFLVGLFFVIAICLMLALLRWIWRGGLRHKSPFLR